MVSAPETASGYLEVHLKVRSHVPNCVCERIEQIVERVENLQDRGTVDAVEISAWDRLYPDRLATPGDEDRRTLQRYLDWAASQGYVLRPAFRCHESTSLVDTASRRTVEVPLVSLAVFEDEALCCVVPYSNGEVVESVEDYLTSLERGDVAPSLDPPQTERPQPRRIELSP